MRRRLLGALALLALPARGAEPMRIVHQGPEAPGDTRNDYGWNVLRMALDKTRERWGPYQMVMGANMNGLRAVEELQLKKLNIVVRATSPELEQAFLPIRIPLDKGLLGYRIFLIRKQIQPLLDRVQTLDQLRKFSVGQHNSWTDVSVLEQSGFKVVRGGNYEGLFGMLANARFDLFSRSVKEVGAEFLANQKRYPDLVIERNLMLHYPLPPYLFVRRDGAGEQLAARIEAGLNIMIKDGSFDRMFNAMKAPLEKEFNMTGRRLFRIPNPLLSPETPLRNSDLWYNPGK